MKTLDPTWNAVFTYPFVEGSTNLYIQVWDWDRASTDDFLGECYVDLKTVGDNPHIEIPLLPQPGKEKEQSYVTGSIFLGVEITDTSAEQSLDAGIVAKLKNNIRTCLENSDPSLNLSGFSLPGLPKIVVERMNFIQNLDLSINKFAAFPDLSRFSVLEELNLMGNMLSALPEEIGTAKTLRILNLNGNVLKTLPHGIGNLLTLEKLEINNNELVELPKEIGRLSLLETLSIAGNPISTLPDSIGAMKNLVNLDMSCCHFTKLPEALTHATRILDLNIGGNQLEVLPDGIGRMTRLVSLNVQDNKLKDLPITIGLCSCLGQIGYGINMARNPIQDHNMLEAYDVGADHLLDYLEKRYAMNNNPPVPSCPFPTDLGEGPLPQWIADMMERQKMRENYQSNSTAALMGKPQASAAPAGAAAAAPAGKPASGTPGLEQKLWALRSWAQQTNNELLRPSFASYRTVVRSSMDMSELLDVAYKLAGLDAEFAKVQALAPFQCKGPGTLSPETPLMDQLRVYTLSAINYVDAGVRAILSALDKCNSQQIANVVQLIQVLNKIKTSFQQHR